MPSFGSILDGNKKLKLLALCIYLFAIFKVEHVPFFVDLGGALLLQLLLEIRTPFHSFNFKDRKQVRYFATKVPQYFLLLTFKSSNIFCAINTKCTYYVFVLMAGFSSGTNCKIGFLFPSMTFFPCPLVASFSLFCRSSI